MCLCVCICVYLRVSACICVRFYTTLYTLYPHTPAYTLCPNPYPLYPLYTLPPIYTTLTDKVKEATSMKQFQDAQTAVQDYREMVLSCKIASWASAKQYATYISATLSDKEKGGLASAASATSFLSGMESIGGSQHPASPLSHLKLHNIDSNTYFTKNHNHSYPSSDSAVTMDMGSVSFAGTRVG